MAEKELGLKEYILPQPVKLNLHGFVGGYKANSPMCYILKLYSIIKHLPLNSSPSVPDCFWEPCTKHVN